VRSQAIGLLGEAKTKVFCEEEVRNVGADPRVCPLGERMERKL